MAGVLHLWKTRTMRQLEVQNIHWGLGSSTVRELRNAEGKTSEPSTEWSVSQRGILRPSHGLVQASKPFNKGFACLFKAHKKTEIQSHSLLLGSVFGGGLI